MTEHGVLDSPAGPAQGPRDAAPRLAEGTELIGPYEGSGYREPKYLVARADEQVIQLPLPLYRLAAALDGHRDADALASQLAADLGRPVSAEQVTSLIETKLRPAGLVAGADDGEAPLPAPTRPDPLFMLRFRVGVVPASVVWTIAGAFAPLFRPVLVVAMLAAFVALDAVIIARGGLGELAPTAIALVGQPALVLLVIASVLVSGVFHEFGHAAACRYGGARPGVMGVGIYLVWPAYFSTVTDSYRLSRAGRLRTDLGGVYFNAISIAGLSVAYLGTGASWLLLAVFTLHVETVRQFLPSVRLDGYYILSDLIGLPDLFMFLRPVLRSVLPWRAADPRVAELRPAVRWIIVAWVLLVIPFLLYFLVTFLVLAPVVLPVLWDTALQYLAVAAAAIRDGQAAPAALAVVQTLFLLLPVLGVGLILQLLVGNAVRALLAPSAAPPRDVPAPPEQAKGTPARHRVAPTPPSAPPSSGPARPVRTLVVVAVPLLLLALLAIAGIDQRVATAGEATLAAAAALRGGLAPVTWPDTFTVQQIDALGALLADLGQQPVVDRARAVLVVANVLGCLLLWPAARRVGMTGVGAALAVALCGLPVPLVLLHATVDAGGLAALWLTLAAAVAGRGRGANAGALGAAAVGVLTAPVAAVGLLAFAALGVLSGTFLPTIRRWVARTLGALLAVAAVLVAWRSTGAGPWVVAGSEVPIAPLVGALVIGAAVLATTWYRLPPLRPVVAGAAVLLACAALPGTHASTALLLAAPALAVSAAAVLVENATVRARPRLGAVAVAAVVVLGAATSGPVVLGAAAADPDRSTLSTWVRTQLDPAVPLRVDALTAAQLARDGVPADRLLPLDATAPAAAVTVSMARPGDPASPTADPGHLLVAVPDGPGGGPAAVHGGGSPDERDGDDRRRLGARLADNARLMLTPGAADALRRGDVDLRLATALAGLLTAHRVSVTDFPAVPGEPGQAPRRTALIDEVDGTTTATPGSTELVQRWLAGQLPPFRPATVTLEQGALVVQYTTPAPPGPTTR